MTTFPLSRSLSRRSPPSRVPYVPFFVIPLAFFPGGESSTWFLQVPPSAQHGFCLTTRLRSYCFRVGFKWLLRLLWILSSHLKHETLSHLGICSLAAPRSTQLFHLKASLPIFTARATACPEATVSRIFWEMEFMSPGSRGGDVTKALCSSL